VLLLCPFSAAIWAGDSVLETNAEASPVATAYAAQPPGGLRAALGQTVRLNIGEAVIFPDIEASLRLVRFAFHSCPSGMQCIRPAFWAAHLELIHRGVVYPHTSEIGSSPFRVTGLGRYGVAVHSSDHKTYAELELFDHGKICHQWNSARWTSYERCWRDLAKRTGETSYCRRLGRKPDRCVEDVAYAFSYDRLCEEVESPADYCLSKLAIEMFDVSLCPRLMKSRFSRFSKIDACYRYLGSKAGGNIGICSVLQDNERTRCIRAIKTASRSPNPNASARYRAVVATDGNALVQGRVTIAGVYWKCYRDQCQSFVLRTFSPEQVCRSLPERIGKVVSFTVGDQRFTEAELQRCNAFKG
jgi:hypothetical protein